jgi:hypothetical protein
MITLKKIVIKENNGHNFGSFIHQQSTAVCSGCGAAECMSKRAAQKDENGRSA